MVPPPAPKRRISRLAIVLLALSMVTGTGSVAAAVIPLVGSLTAPTFAFPGTTTVTIDDPGTYAVYEQTGSQRRAGPVNIGQNHGRALDPAGVTVSGPDGRVDTSTVSGHQTLDRNGDIFTASVEFEAVSPGTYRIDLDAGAASGTAVVAREVSDQLVASLPWFLAALASGLMVLGALVALIVSAVRAARANRPPPTPPVPPAGPGFPGPAAFPAPYPSAPLHRPPAPGDFPLPS